MHDQDTGTLLRRLRLERGWTQRQAAELLGVSAQAVSKWERGQGCPDVGMLPRQRGGNSGRRPASGGAGWRKYEKKYSFTCARTAATF